ncbi:MAG TPA: 6-hydroxycyclohex-1-ene-1-carbonyl-CoA dehydrogenase [Thermoanaerobaculia bacterium]|nr:6-hydroxycyclohex-1-ene-1-carbonyl-CoA dehydrogenase [Thermoanaerobaculia bacterium]
MQAQAYFLVAPAKPLEMRPLTLPEPAPDEVVVEVVSCGLCHTDLSYASGAVRPRHELPLVLGHEVTGRVVAAGEDYAGLVGEPVLVPAVLPCGDCAFCRGGRSNICPHQKMPGNDIHGGFASHLLVPARFLVSLADTPPEIGLAAIAVVADAVSTAYQAVRRSGLGAGDVAFVVGAGGVGSFVMQVARAMGARTVLADIRREQLDAAAACGAERTYLLAGDRQVDRRALQAMAREWGVPSLGWRVFECSGTAAGQALAFSLLGPAATLMVVGFTPDKLSLRLSNLMAFDATVHGTWGCPPEAYPEVLELIYRGKVSLEPFIEHAPMSDLNRLLEEMAAHRLGRRMILHPA